MQVESQHEPGPALARSVCLRGGGALYEDAMLMYEAAAAGQGVALTLNTLFDGYSAQLIKPFALEVWDRAYTIVLAPEADQKPGYQSGSQIPERV